MTISAISLVSGLLLASCGTAQAATVAGMQWSRRVLLVSAQTAQDPELLAQQKILAAWQGADDRDVSVVTISGDAVAGAADAAADLRRKYGLAPNGFSVALVGKDGHVAMRARHPFTAETLTGTIDAMPMRRAGQR